MDDQLTFRLGADLARRVRARARSLGVRRSVLARLALERFLASEDVAPGDRLQEHITPYLGAVRLDPGALERDALAERVRRHNWRE